MSRKKLDSAALAQARTALQAGERKASIARRLGVHESTLARQLQKAAALSESKPVPITPHTPRPPKRSNVNYAWDLEAIRNARDEQMRGQFRSAVRLAEGLRTDDAIFVARRNRIAPARAIKKAFRPYDSDAGRKILRRVERGITIEEHTVESIHGTLVDHGVAIGLIRRDVDEGGALVRFRVEEWPLEFVRWNSSTELLETQTLDGQTVPITHGDGTWIVFRKFGLTPWTQDASVPPAALLWAAHAEGLQWWAASTMAHGLAKIVGELPAGVSLQDAEGNLSPEAQWFLSMLADLASGEAVAGLRPANAKTEFLSNGSSAWQVYETLVTNREKAAMRIYCGTDAALGSVGGAPGVDIAALFNVSTTILQGDFTAIEQGINSGAVVPFVRTNLGESFVRIAPCWGFEMPDTDSATRQQERSAAMDRLLSAIEKMRAQRLVVTQEVVNDLAVQFGVEPVPQLAADESTPRAQLALAPTDIAKVVTVDEVRVSQGLTPIGGVKGATLISELEIKAEAQAEATAPPEAP